jgi:cyclopropane fatty-acyl-phospholipid synthase-like methyltransferase
VDLKKRTKQTHIQETLIAKDYRSNQTKFDEILSAVGDYFELFKNNTNKLEDLWL